MTTYRSGLRSSSGSLAMFAAIRLASSRVRLIARSFWPHLHALLTSLFFAFVLAAGPELAMKVHPGIALLMPVSRAVAVEYEIDIKA